MIWSSAQPVNVRNMVEACFGRDEVIGEENVDASYWGDSDSKKGGPGEEMPKKVFMTRRLKAIWARDTLGLSRNQYCAFFEFLICGGSV